MASRPEVAPEVDPGPASTLVALVEAEGATLDEALEALEEPREEEEAEGVKLVLEVDAEGVLATAVAAAAAAGAGAVRA